MNIKNTINEILESINDDLEFVKFFKKNYFIDEYEMIFESIIHGIYGSDNIIKLSNLAIQYPKLKWIYLSAAGSCSYIAKQDEKSLRYYEELTQEFKLCKNSERLMMTYSNMCFSYNRLENYTRSYKLTLECLEYIYSYKDSIWIDNMIMHYLFTSFVLDRHDEILEFHTNPLFRIERLNWVTASICILSANIINQLHKVSQIIYTFDHDDNVSIILEYIKTKDKEKLNNVKKTPYIKIIIDKL
jgi:hypothetical protein